VNNRVKMANCGEISALRTSYFDKNNQFFDKYKILLKYLINSYVRITDVINLTLFGSLLIKTKKYYRYMFSKFLKIVDIQHNRLKIDIYTIHFE